MELIRYIHLNPVRSSLATKPNDYRWSGHNAYLGKTKCEWLSTDWVLQHFDRKKSDARKAYHRYVMSRVDEEYRKESHGRNHEGVALGDEEFIIKLPEYGKSKHFRNDPISDVAEISKQVCTFYQVPESPLNTSNRSHLASKIRSLVTLLYSEQPGTTISRVAEYLDKDISTLSRNLINLKKRLLTDAQLRQDAETLKNTKMQA